MIIYQILLSKVTFSLCIGYSVDQTSDPCGTLCCKHLCSYQLSTEAKTLSPLYTYSIQYHEFNIIYVIANAKYFLSMKIMSQSQFLAYIINKDRALTKAVAKSNSIMVRQRENTSRCGW